MSILLVAFYFLSFQQCKNAEKNQDRNDYSDVNIYKDSLDQIFTSFQNQGHLPGFSVSIFTAHSTFFQKGYGYADIEEKRPMTTKTVQGIASISKTLIAVCLMHAVEKELVRLDDPINKFLPFKVTHPLFPNIPITLKQLANHTSGISDDGSYDYAYIFSEPLDTSQFPKAWAKYITVYNQNEDMTMEAYLKDVFSTEGKWYSNQNFTSKAPGTNYEYSNIGASLLAYCLQLVMDKDYREICRELIFEPLNMQQTDWVYDKKKKQDHITYYNENYNAVPPYYTTTYPDGGLFTTINDLRMYMQEMMRGYYGQGKILSSESFKIMMTNQIPELDTPTGIIWDMDNTCCIGHGGNDFGIATMMFFNPENGIGKILFSNIAVEKEAIATQFYDTFNAMFSYDEEISKLLK